MAGPVPGCVHGREQFPPLMEGTVVAIILINSWGDLEKSVFYPEYSGLQCQSMEPATCCLRFLERKQRGK